MSNKRPVMYLRSGFMCPYVAIAEGIFQKYQLQYDIVDIDSDPAARQRVLEWTGFVSVPTLVVANPGEVLPYQPQTPLKTGESPRGIDRGTMITEPNSRQLEAWLAKHGFLAAESVAQG
jgi:glutaredoxin